MKIEMIIRGHVPSKSNCYKIVSIAGHATLAKTKPLKEYEQKFFMQCPHRNLMINEYFILTMNVFYETMNPDLDNAFKIVLDCLQKPCGVIKNDNKCVEIHSFKHIDKVNPRIELTIETIDI